MKASGELSPARPEGDFQIPGRRNMDKMSFLLSIGLKRRFRQLQPGYLTLVGRSMAECVCDGGGESPSTGGRAEARGGSALLMSSCIQGKGPPTG